MRFTRITVNPNQMGGVPCIRGLRIPVATIVGMVADGMSEEKILKALPDLLMTSARQGTTPCMFVTTDYSRLMIVLFSHELLQKTAYSFQQIQILELYWHYGKKISLL